MEKHSHSHHHSHSHINSNNLLFTAILNIIITIVEFIGALFSGSLSLMSDASHNFSDTISIVAAYFANRIGSKEANTEKTFGYKRIEILTALFNATTLILITFFIIKEAFYRISNPEDIETTTMIVVAITGLCANIAGALLLHNDSKKNLNIKASYLHLLSDAFSSLLVIVGGILVSLFNILWIDALLSLIIAFFILWNVFFILKNTFHILMQSTPEGIDIIEVCKEIENIPGISNVHHVHAWSLDEHHKFFEGHICTTHDLKLSESQMIVEKVEHVVKDHFGFTHTTLQIEFHSCEDKRIIQ